MNANDAIAAKARARARPAAAFDDEGARATRATGVGQAAWHRGDSAPVSGSSSNTTWYNIQRAEGGLASMTEGGGSREGCDVAMADRCRRLYRAACLG